MKNKQYNRMLQVLVDTDTYDKMQRLIMLESIENNVPMLSKSAWIRELIEDTVNFQINKYKIADYKGELIKQLKAK